MNRITRVPTTPALCGALLACFGPTSTTAQEADPVEGTYRFAVCADRCQSLEGPSLLVRGRLVLSGSPIPLPAFSDTADLALQWAYYQINLIRDSQPNGCHVTDDVPRTPRSAAGWERVGVTHWIRSPRDHRVHFGLLWSGVDASYNVAIVGEGRGVLRGVGRATDFSSDETQDLEYFLAERTGPADPSTCTSVQREP